MSILTLKQHFIADAVAALLVVTLVHDRVLRRFRSDRDDGPPAFSWRGPAAYLVVQAGLYAALALAFAAGVQV